MKDFVEDVFEDMINGIHTIKPCVVSKVDYTKNTVNVKILTQTRVADEVQEEFPDLYDVPLMVLSAAGGTMRITMPVAVGDNVVVLMSDRSFSDLITKTGGKVRVEANEFKTHDLYPILAIPCFSTFSTAKPIDPVNTVIECGTTQMLINPTAGVTITSPLTAITGDLVVAGSITGESIISTSLVSNTIVASASLTVNGRNI